MWPFHDDILDPRSRHNRHVTRRDDVPDVGAWPGEVLYAAVEFADGARDDGSGDAVVVLDYGRSTLYIALGSGLTYHPPVRLGVVAPPALDVAEPRVFDPEAGTATPTDPVTVSPEFDVLVPAFDWEDMKEEDVLPPIDSRPSRAPSDAGTGTPG